MSPLDRLIITLTQAYKASTHHYNMTTRHAMHLTARVVSLLLDRSESECHFLPIIALRRVSLVRSVSRHSFVFSRAQAARRTALVASNLDQNAVAVFVLTFVDFLIGLLAHARKLFSSRLASCLTVGRVEEINCSSFPLFFYDSTVGFPLH